eukprot:SAG31_NODE_6035_length_2199_cov_1.148095_3_plen_232_part_01
MIGTSHIEIHTCAVIGVGLGLPWLLSNTLENEVVVLRGHAEVQRLIWFHVFAITLFSTLTLGQVIASRPIAHKATLTPIKGLILFLGYVVILCTYIVSNRARAAAAQAVARGEIDDLSWGTGEWFFSALFVAASGSIGYWCYHGVTQRREAMAQERELEREFYRLKFEKQHGSKSKEDVAPSLHVEGQKNTVRPAVSIGGMDEIDLEDDWNEAADLGVDAVVDTVVRSETEI